MTPAAWGRGEEGGGGKQRTLPRSTTCVFVVLANTWHTNPAVGLIFQVVCGLVASVYSFKSRQHCRSSTCSWCALATSEETDGSKECAILNTFNTSHTVLMLLVEHLQSHAANSHIPSTDTTTVVPASAFACSCSSSTAAILGHRSCRSPCHARTPAPASCDATRRRRCCCCTLNTAPCCSNTD